MIYLLVSTEIFPVGPETVIMRLHSARNAIFNTYSENAQPQDSPSDCISVPHEICDGRPRPEGIAAKTGILLIVGSKVSPTPLVIVSRFDPPQVQCEMYFS
jgi:hypothetical protein